MKKKDLKRLLELFDNNNQNAEDFKEFRNPSEATEGLRNLNLIRNELSSRNNEFSPYFTSKVMGKINLLSVRPGLEEYLSMQLSRVMTYGLSAVAAIILAMFIFQGQEGIQAVIGADHSNDVNFISSLFYEF